MNDSTSNADIITKSPLKTYAGNIDRTRLDNFITKMRDEFIHARPKSYEIYKSGAETDNNYGFFGGVPQHWMLDWPTPFPIYIDKAKGKIITDIDGNRLVDLCLGDTGAMFGHSPDVIANTLKEVAENGITAMLPSKYSDFVGKKLVEVFGLPYWQIAMTASDANRFALSVARLVSGRSKIIVFDGCYHGAVDETTVYLDDNGKTLPKPSLWGSAFDPSENTYCVPFNDPKALEAALSGNDVACIIMEPALTNCGIVPPVDGFLDFAIDTAHKYGAYVLMDETHTLSTGLGGYTKTFNLKPDLFVAGKAIAGGIPTAIWGFSAEIKEKIDIARETLPAGHSGIGTTLGGSLLQLAALNTSLKSLMIAETYDKMIASSKSLEIELNNIISEFNLDWRIIRIGARLEIVFSGKAPINAVEMRKTFDHDLEQALHLGLINNGILVTPFHNMLLAGPDLNGDDISHYGNVIRNIIREICV